MNFKAKDTLEEIFNVMKVSSLSENIASEIPYLIPIDELVKNDDGILVLCNIVNAIPEILPVSAVIDYNLLEIFENLYNNNLTSTSALLLRLAQEKFAELTANDEYLSNPTLILKVLSKLKEQKALKAEHKQLAIDSIEDETLRACILAL